MDDDSRFELRRLSAQVRDLLEAERELGSRGLALPVLPTAPAAPGASQGPTGTTRPAAGGGQPAGAQPADVGDREQHLQLLAKQAAACNDCVLHEKRNRNVFARGSARAQLVFVGEGPGRDEDRTGLPFVGPAGQLLDRMIAAMGFDGEQEVYICNVVKCRPPENRTPRPAEALACRRFLEPQLQLVAPRVIVALGRCAAQHLGVAGADGPWRGRWGSWQDVPVMSTYHPAFLLRSPQHKRTVWQDLQQVMARFDKKPPARS